MYKVSFKPSFVRQAKKLDRELFEIVLEKIELLKDQKNHSLLKVHKLHGRLSDYYSFSINYGIRIIFKFETKKEIVLVDMGSHDMYK